MTSTNSNTIALTSSQIDAWDRIGCFDEDAARALASAGITVEDASQRVEVCGYTDTIGYAVSNGDMSVEDALEFIAR